MQDDAQSEAWLELAGGLRTPVRGTCFIGRPGSNHLVLPDLKVSRRHAIVHAHRPGEFWLIDLGSSNGTYLNGRRISQPSRLHDHDRIEIAGFALTFHQPQPTHGDSLLGAATQTVREIRTLNCWLLVADIESSTQFVQRLSPDELSGVLGNWLLACKDIVESHGGTINKFLGDGFFAFWIDRDPSLASLTSALLALKKLQAQGRPRFRVVVHYGQATMGGSASLGEENLVGKDVHFAFRIEKAASQVGASTWLSQEANARLQAVLPTTDEGAHPVPGFSGDFHFFSF